MPSNEERILTFMLERGEPLTRETIARAVGLPANKVSKAIQNLEGKGLVISRGATAARRHMTLAAAVHALFREVSHLARHSKIKTPSWM